MKYEVSDIIKNKYIYGLTILRIHKKADKGVIFKMVLKIPIYTYFLVHFLFLIVSSMNTLILCGDFIPNSEGIYLSTWLKKLTPYFIVEKFHITNLSYIIICTFMIILCIIRYLYFLYLIYKTKHYHLTEVYNIKVNFIIVILNHIVYVFFSYIIEFLSFIIYIEVFPDTFIIKKNKSLHSCLNIIFIILNSFFIIIYNSNNYQSIELMNKPDATKNYPFQMRISKIKFFILIFFQNISVFQPLTIYLNNSKSNISKIFNISINIIIIILFIISYFISLKSFNYNNILNKTLSFIGEFGFSSLIFEIILYVLSVDQNNSQKLVLLVLIKLLIAICLNYILEIVYSRLMLRDTKKKLFINSLNNYSFNNNLVNNILYLKELIENKNNKILVIIIKYLYNHQKFCLNKICGCKMIKITSYYESDIIQKLDEYLKQINYYIESILIKYDFKKNFELAYLISEHFFKNKKNPIMAYSVLQTLLHLNYKNLSTRELVLIYGTLNKYIKYTIKQKINDTNLEKFNNDKNKLIEDNKENELRQYFNILIKIKKITKLMKEYSLSFNIIIKYKQRYENSIQIELDERDGEIERINSSLLTNSFITEMIHFLQDENSKTNEVKKFLFDLKEYNKILSFEFIYKCFLFVDYFWNAIIPNELIDILYGFTTNRNIYSSSINQEIYELLEDMYKENYRNENRKFFLLLKYTKSIKISYISETLTRKLDLFSEDIINQDLNSLLIKDLVVPHNYVINQYFMIKQNRVLMDRTVHIFNNKKYMIENSLSSTLQIGLNKNILAICTIQLNEKNNEITFFANKNLEIISINQSFENKFNISLALLEEFKTEIKDLFGVSKNNIKKKYKKEIKSVKEIKNFIRYDPKEHVLKNIFNTEIVKDNYRFIDETLFNEDKEKWNEYSDEDEEKKTLKPKIKSSILKIIKQIFNNKTADMISLKSINFKINNEIIINKMRNLVDKISAYEEGKLENKNLYNDFMRLNQNFTSLFKNNYYFILNIRLKLVYDQSFYLCKIEQYENELLINEIIPRRDKKKSLRADKERTINKKAVVSFTRKTTILTSDKEIKTIKNKEPKKKYHFRNSIKFRNNVFREKIRANKISKTLLGIILVSLILILLVVYIIILVYQINLVNQGDKIFKTLYYNYYQKSKLLYIYSVILSIHYNIVNLSEANTIKESQTTMNLLVQDLENGFHLFYSNYMDYKTEIGENVDQLYKKREISQISVNWEKEIVYNDYINEMQLMLYRVFDIANENKFTEGDTEDCFYFLLQNYKKLGKNRKNVEIHGNLIRLLYYLYKNYDRYYDYIYNELTLSFENSFQNYTNRTNISYLCLEILGILIYIIFFLINFYFLFKSNKYIFQNLLCLFLDFTQKAKYTFNNKTDNILLNKIISNYISLLNEFSPKRLEKLKNEVFNFDADKDFKYMSTENPNFESTFKELENLEGKNLNQNQSKKYFLLNSKKDIKYSKKNLEIAKKITKKDIDIFNEDNNKNIHKLNLSNLSNNNNKESKGNSSKSIINANILMNSSNNLNIHESNIHNNSSLINLNKSLENDDSLFPQKNKNTENIINSISDSNLTLDKIIILSKILFIKIIKIIMIIFVAFSIIFTVYYIIKIIFGFLIIIKIKMLFTDFKVMVSHYNEIVHYWNNIKTLVILPNSTIYVNLSVIESYFEKKNTDVLNLINSRINNYKRTSILYNNIFNPKDYTDLLKADFCDGHEKCYKLINSTQNIMLNGLNSAISLYGKEIANYYKDYLKVKDILKDRDDIKKYFIKDTYEILSMNLNNIITHLQEKFYKDFLKDEIDSINSFNDQIRILNIIALCYCLSLNLFSILFVFNYINKINDFVEISSIRINVAICHLKEKILI